MTYVTGRSNASATFFAPFDEVSLEDDLSDLSYRDDESQRAIKKPRIGSKTARVEVLETCEESNCSESEEYDFDESDPATREKICGNIRLLITLHQTMQTQLIDWCECGQSTISRLLSNTKYCSDAVRKIAAYYHVSLRDLASPHFEQTALKKSYPMPNSELSDERVRLKRIAYSITLLCYQRVITEKQLADWCQCHEQLIHTIKKGSNRNNALIERVANYFKMSVNDLADPNFELPGLSHVPRTLDSSKLKKYFRKQIGVNVTLLMKHHKVKRKQLSSWCDCYPATINKVKTGSDSASLVIAKIAHFFAVFVSDLVSPDFEKECLQKALPGLTGSKEEAIERWKHFGDNLKALREKLQIGLQEMAHAVKYGYSVIQSFEEGSLQDEEKARQIVEAFHLKLGDFLLCGFVKNLRQHEIEACKKRLRELL